MKEYTLNECFDLIRNGASIKQFKASGIPITRIETISSGIIDYSKVGYADIFDDKYSDFYLKENDILMSHINSEKHLGKVAIVKGINQKIIHGMNLLILRYKKDIIYPKYIYYYFKTNKFKLNIFKISKKSVNQASFNVSELKKIRVFLPNTRKQQEISEKLDKVTEIIKKQKEQLELLENLKKSQFFEMFGNPIKNEKGWEKVSMDEISRLIIRGKTPKYVMDSKIGIINQACIYWEKIKFENIKYHENNEKVLNLENQDVLINSTGTGTLGRVNIFTKDKENDKVYTIDTHVTLVRLKKEKVNSIYLKNFFRVPIVQEYLMSRCVNGSTNQIELSKEKFKKFRVLLPPLELQNKFATKIEAIQKLKFEIEKSLKETENLYNSLMQKFFSNK